MPSSVSAVPASSPPSGGARRLSWKRESPHIRMDVYRRSPPPPSPSGSPAMYYARSNSSGSAGSNSTPPRPTPAALPLKHPYSHHHHLPPAASPTAYNLPPYQGSWEGGPPAFDQVRARPLMETFRGGACTCKKSRCLKLYCQCFASSTTCGSRCKCQGCQNTPQHGEAIEAARKVILDRNPAAFDDKFPHRHMPPATLLHVYPPPPPPPPTVVAPMSHSQSTIAIAQAPTTPILPPKTVAEESSARPQKVGCKCRRSFCLKKYCECFQNGLTCGVHCRCINCKNTSPDKQRPPSTGSLQMVAQDEREKSENSAIGQSCEESSTSSASSVCTEESADEGAASADKDVSTDRMAIMAAVAMTELLNQSRAPAKTKQPEPQASENNDELISPARPDVVPRQVTPEGEKVTTGKRRGMDFESIQRLPPKKRKSPSPVELETALPKKDERKSIDEREEAVVESMTSSMTLESRNPSPVSHNPRSTPHAQVVHAYYAAPPPLHAGYRASPPPASHAPHYAHHGPPPPPPPPSMLPPPSAAHYYSYHPSHHSAHPHHDQAYQSRASPPPYYAYHAPPPPPPPHHPHPSYPTPHYTHSLGPPRHSPPPPVVHSSAKPLPQARPPTSAPSPSYEDLLKSSGLPKSLSFRKICSRCGKTRSEHGELGFGNKCVFQECGKCLAGLHMHQKCGQPMGILCQLTVEQGAKPGAAAAYERKIQELAARAEIQREMQRRKSDAGEKEAVVAAVES